MESYQPLQPHEEGPVGDGDWNVQTPSNSSRSVLVRNLLALLALSLFINVFTIFERRHATGKTACKSEFAQLERIITRPFVIEGLENTIPSEMWEYPKPEKGMVALADEYVQSLQLPRAQRYPWDSGKGLYFLHGHHNYHCLLMIRSSILEYRNQSKQSEPRPHIDHCLTALRDDIICNADDTPRYTGRHHKQPGSGIGQVRLCRDWAKLDEWAKEHTACYKEPEDWLDGKPVDRYKHCPDGSKPWEKFRRNLTRF